MKKYLISLAIALFCLCSCSDKDDKDPYADYRLQCYEFLMDNATREEVIVTPSGLQYEVLREGTGKSPKVSDLVRCQYKGWFIDGEVFDSTQNGNSAVFALNQVISGWTEGLQLMKEGAKYRFYIPYTLGYGPNGYSSIPPFAALIFDVELLEVL